MALILLSAMGLAMTYTGMTDVRINQNSETHNGALALAETGLNHAIEQMRYLFSSDIADNSFTFILRGPNNVTTDNGAGTISYRNPVSLSLARSLDVSNQLITGSEAGTVWDPSKSGSYRVIGQNGVKWMLSPGPDGIFGTADDKTYFVNPGPDGLFGTNDDLTIPKNFATSSKDAVIGRYFIKVINNPDDSGGPFTDTDAKVMIRCIASVTTLPGELGSGGNSNRRNSVAIVEAVIKRAGVFNLRAATEDYGTAISEAEFEHNKPMVPYVTGFVNGDPTKPNPIVGIGAISDATVAGYTAGATSGIPSPATQITGVGGTPSIGNITNTLRQRGEDQLLDPNFWVFLRNFLKNMADVKPTSQPDLVSALQGTSPTNQKIIYYEGSGELGLEGPITGNGILILNGFSELEFEEGFTFNGLILNFPSAGSEGPEFKMEEGSTINGGLITVPLGQVGGNNVFMPSGEFELEGDEHSDNPSRIIYQPMMFRFGLSRMPLTRVSYREIKWEMDQR